MRQQVDEGAVGGDLDHRRTLQHPDLVGQLLVAALVDHELVQDDVRAGRG